MSYNVNLKVESGTVTVESQTGTVPDGRFMLWGHETVSEESAGLARFDAHGSKGIAVNGSVPVKGT